ncbi:MAG: universal stress protein [Candidatus Cybelea sp.]
MLKNFVVALDGSECALRALDLALMLAKGTSSKISVCSVADPAPAYGTGSPATIEEAVAQIHAHAKSVVDQALAKAIESGATATGIVLDGEPVFEIVSYAKAIGADGIVAGTHGRSGLKRLFMGSVAEGVLRTASVPVFTVRAEARVATNARILVPIDGSSCSLEALDLAVGLAAQLDAEVIVCHVVDLARAATMSGGQAQLVAGCLEELEAEGMAIVAAAKNHALGRVSISAQTADGAPVAEIVRLAAAIEPAFIVIGSHGRSGFNRLVMGSVTEGLVRSAPVPVMVVPRERK